MKLIYDVESKPPIKSNLVFALQQLLAIIAATILVPLLVNDGGKFGEGVEPFMSQAAALVGAGFGTLFYIFATKKKSPVFLGSSFAFISPLCTAVTFGYLGVFLGAVFAGLVYLVIAFVIKKTGSAWVNKLLPPVVIGPTVALIGLSLCTSAINNMNALADSYNLITILCGIITFAATIYASVRGKKMMKMIPFIFGIAVGYAVCALFTLFGHIFNCDYIKIINFQPLVDNFSKLSLSSFFSVPKMTFLGIIEEGASKLNWDGVATLFFAFAPVAFVVLAEHIADHKNLSTIIDRDLITDPGLDKTLIGDGVGSVIGSFFGGCPNTTYGESVGCIAITGNASVSTIIIASFYAIILAFFSPFVALINTIPNCVMGGICIALYGFIAVSGLKMLQHIDLGDNRNLFVVAAILVPGIGGLTLNFGSIVFTNIATALILGILVNIIFNKRSETELSR